MRTAIAYAGQPGAFAEDACITFCPGDEPIALAGFAEVAAAVAEDRVRRGMLPLENSIAGQVPGVAALIADARLAIEQRHRLAIRLHLLGLDGSALGELRLVRSHPMALAQCTESLARLGLAGEAADNTAAAAQRLARSGDRTIGVIASQRAAERYGLTILARDLQDRADNLTTFGVVARGDSAP